MIFTLRAEVSDPGEGGSCDKPDLEVARLLEVAAARMRTGSHPGDVNIPGGFTASYGYGGQLDSAALTLVFSQVRHSLDEALAKVSAAATVLGLAGQEGG